MDRLGQINLFTRRVSRPPPAPEFNTHCMIADLLRRFANPGWRWWHIPSGEKRSPATGARLKRMGVQRGLPDFELLAPLGASWRARPHFLELKRRGGALSEEQKEFAAWCGANDVPYAVVKSFDEALTQLKAWGAVRTGVEVSA
jgi:hypothetical protein